MCLVNKKKLEQTKEIMHKGDLYLPNDTNLLIHQTFRLEKLRKFKQESLLKVHDHLERVSRNMKEKRINKVINLSIRKKTMSM